MRTLPTIRGVNFLYLVTMILILVVGSALQAWQPAWGLVATEWLLILPAALIYLFVARLPLTQTLRLRWPGWNLAGLSLLTGIGVALLAFWLGVVLSALFGYTFPVPPGLLPTTWQEALVVFLAMSISAPICEETLFRGVIQRGYERLGPWVGVLVGGALFAVYHLSFQRLLALIPIALALGYLAWRNNSLIASILAHFSYNTLAVILLILGSFQPNISLDFLYTLPAAMIGLVIALISMWLVYRWTSPPVVDFLEPERSSLLGKSWSIAIALLIFLSIGALEVVLGRFPQALASEGLHLQAPDWSLPATWKYQLRNVLDEQVGDATCTLTEEPEVYELDCTVNQQAYQARQGKSLYQSDAFQSRSQIRWDRNTLLLSRASMEQEGDTLNEQVNVEQTANGLVLTVQQNSQKRDLSLPSDALISGEWPWRVSGIPFQVSYIRKVTLAWPLRWSPEQNRNLPLNENLALVVSGGEPLSVPAGNFIAWKVILDDETAWYDTQPPHVLLRYDNGFQNFVLAESK